MFAVCKIPRCGQDPRGRCRTGQMPLTVYETSGKLTLQTLVSW